jgi:hypothetical protein
LVVNSRAQKLIVRHPFQREVRSRPVN